MLLLGNRGGNTAPSFPPSGFTEVMKDPLQHNLAQFRQVAKRIDVGGGKMSKEILGSDPPPKMAWVDREKQTDLAAAIGAHFLHLVLKFPWIILCNKMEFSATKCIQLIDTAADGGPVFPSFFCDFQ